MAPSSGDGQFYATDFRPKTIVFQMALLQIGWYFTLTLVVLMLQIMCGVDTLDKRAETKPPPLVADHPGGSGISSSIPTTPPVAAAATTVGIGIPPTLPSSATGLQMDSSTDFFGQHFDTRNYSFETYRGITIISWTDAT